MDKKEAIEFLRQCLKETPTIRALHDDQKFALWESKVRDILEKYFTEVDLNDFRYTRTTYTLTFSDTAKAKQDEYTNNVNQLETGLKKIIQRYEILGVEIKPATIAGIQPRAFISHGGESIALTKIERFLSELGVEPLIVKDKPTLDKDLPDKVDSYLNQADFVIILATGDDEIVGKRQPRQNVIHEIGLAQKTHAGKIIYLLEEGAEFPSNISPKVRESFNQDNMENVFLRIVIELRALKILRAGKVEEQT